MGTMFVVIALGIAFIAIYYGEIFARARAWQGRASLAKKLPPDVQVDMKPKLLHLMTALAIAAVFFGGVRVDLVTHTRTGTHILFVGCVLVATVAVAAQTAWIARSRLDRGYLGEVLVDLSPYPLAGAIGLRLGLLFAMFVMALFGMIDISLTGLPRAVGWLFLAVWSAIALLLLWTYFKYVDRIWLAERGLCFGGKFYPWEWFERVAWSDDGRVFALRRRGLWVFQRWTVVPVHPGSREEVEEVLLQVLPAPSPML
jgi:hypothetical protein